MGQCHDFGVEIEGGCVHPMQAAGDRCVCPECDAVCKGQFKGCAEVWARGPRSIHLADHEMTGESSIDSSLASPGQAGRAKGSPGNYLRTITRPDHRIELQEGAGSFPAGPNGEEPAFPLVEREAVGESEGSGSVPQGERPRSGQLGSVGVVPGLDGTKSLESAVNSLKSDLQSLTEAITHYDATGVAQGDRITARLDNEIRALRTSMDRLVEAARQHARSSREEMRSLRASLTEVSERSRRTHDMVTQQTREFTQQYATLVELITANQAEARTLLGGLPRTIADGIRGYLEGSQTGSGALARGSRAVKDALRAKR